MWIHVYVGRMRKDWKQPGCPLVGGASSLGLVYSLEDIAGVRNKEEGFDKTRSPRYG